MADTSGSLRLAFGLLVLVLALAGLGPGGTPAVAVPRLDALRYAGTWFEVARMPGAGRRGCDRDVTTTYAPRADGGFDVVERCVRHDGRLTVAHGLARVRAGDGSVARLEVDFWPRWLRALGLGWRDHWVLAIDTDYRVAVIGDRGGGDLRVLSRVPEAQPERLVPMLAALQAHGYAVDELVRTPQLSAGVLPTRRLIVLT